MSTLVVVNQDVMGMLKQLPSRLPPPPWTFLSSHQFFDQEIRKIQCLPRAASTRFITMASLLSEEEMVECEERAIQNAREGADYAASLVRHKNEICRNHMLAQGRFDSLATMDGLGVSAICWKEQGASLLRPASAGATERARAFLSRLRRRLCRRQGRLIQYAEMEGLQLRSFEPLRRVTLHPNVRFAERHATQPCSSTAVTVTTIHQFTPEAARCHHPLLILVDGYHPPNYTAAYIHIYPEDSVFLCPDPFSAHWFSSHGRQVFSAPWLMPPLLMEETAALPRPGEPLVFCLMLNHAGDWSGLIERSDTDRLVDLFCTLPRHFPQHRFIVRAHPTMSTVYHEGTSSWTRLKNHVEGLGIPNLSFSSASLEEDFRRSNVIVSEYSLTLVTAWCRGMCGFSWNPTRRRSFMQAFTDTGFPHASSLEEAIDLVQKASDSPEAFRLDHVRAATEYNGLCRKWTETGSITPSELARLTARHP